MKNTQIQKKSRFTAENVATAAFVAAAFLAPTVGMAAAPILIVGVLIGAAGQIAKMLVGNADSCSAGTTSAMFQVLQFFA